MRVVMVSKALIVGAYQRKAEEIAQLGVELTVLTPPAWNDDRGEQQVEMLHTTGYTFRVIPIRFGGDFHLHHYPTLAQELARLQPDVLHMDEEPYNLATWLALRAAHRLGIASTFFTWQNLFRRYPPPFRQMEKASHRWAPIAIAGNQEAAEVLRRKGYAGEIVVIPQFGVDPAIFHPAPTIVNSQSEQAELRIGYAGGLLPEKGVDLLLEACAGLRGEWRLLIVGKGSSEPVLRAQSETLGLDDWVTFAGRVKSSAMPDFYRGLDVLVLPSRTTAGWKEQFGRVLVEAMACGVAVVGSNSGEIPQVIGKGGLIFPENDAARLRVALQHMLDAPDERRKLATAGRQRVLDRFTMAQIARQTVEVYERLQGANRQSK